MATKPRTEEMYCAREISFLRLGKLKAENKGRPKCLQTKMAEILHNMLSNQESLFLAARNNSQPQSSDTEIAF